MKWNEIANYYRIRWCLFSYNFKFSFKIKFPSSNFRIFAVLQAAPSGIRFAHGSYMLPTINAMLRGYRIYLQGQLERGIFLLFLVNTPHIAGADPGFQKGVGTQSGEKSKINDIHDHTNV